MIDRETLLMGNSIDEIKWGCSVVVSKEEMNNHLNKIIDDAKKTNKI